MFLAATLFELLIPWQVEPNPAVLQFLAAMKVPEPTRGAKKMNLSCLDDFLVQEKWWYTRDITRTAWDMMGINCHESGWNTWHYVNGILIRIWVSIPKCPDFRLANYYNLSKYMFFAQKGELWWGKTGASEVLTVPSRWKNKNVESTDMSVSDNGVYTHDGKLNFANWCKTIGFGYNIFGQTTQEFGAGECPPFFPGCSAHRFTSINPSKLDVNDMQDRKLLTHSKW